MLIEWKRFVSFAESQSRTSQFHIQRCGLRSGGYAYHVSKRFTESRTITRIGETMKINLRQEAFDALRRICQEENMEAGDLVSQLIVD